MLFNSFEYLFLFLPVVFFLYFALHRRHKSLAAILFLITASLFFYAYWKTEYLLLLLFSIGVNYIIGKTIVRLKRSSRRSKRLLVVGILFNLGLLGYFKYYDFFIENLNTVFGFHLEHAHIVLPLAISFFTFQQIAYLVDAYRGEVKAYGFLNYVLFVTFFPQLIAGPIVHHKEMMPQFASRFNWVVRYKNLVSGLFIFSIGLFKKVVIADSFAVWANRGFDAANGLNFFEAWVTSLSYTMQIYFDFSGYTDMAIGAALLFNIRLPINFYSPYKARNIREFWRRWHMTLTRFLRDYLYIPLGGNRQGTLKTYRNIFLVFLLGGIWHGAGWTFAAWGALHGLALIVHRLWSRLSVTMPGWLAWLLTFNFVNFTWVFFRAKDFEEAMKVLHGMLFGKIVLPAAFADKLHPLKNFGIEFGDYLGTLQTGSSTIVKLLGAILLVLVAKNSVQLTFESEMSYPKVLYSAALFVVSVLLLNRVSEFIYFNF